MIYYRPSVKNAFIDTFVTKKTNLYIAMMPRREKDHYYSQGEIKEKKLTIYDENLMWFGNCNVIINFDEWATVNIRFCSRNNQSFAVRILLRHPGIIRKK